MAKSKFKMPDPILDTVFYKEWGAIAVNRYRHYIFDKSNPKMSNGKNFPQYSKRGSKWVTMNVKKKFKKGSPKEGYSYEQAKQGNMLRRQHSGYANSTAPYVSGDLMRDTNWDYSVKDNAIYIGWIAESNKVDWLRDMKPSRILTSHQHPYPKSELTKLMPEINKHLKRLMPKGSQTITIGKK